MSTLTAATRTRRHLHAVTGDYQPDTAPQSAPVTDPLREAAVTAVFNLDAAAASADSFERILELVQAKHGRVSTTFVHDQGWIAGAIYGYLAAHADQADTDLAEATQDAIRALESSQRQAARQAERALKSVTTQ